MPRHENTYPPEIRHSPSGERLYGYWKKIRADIHVPEFDLFMDFYQWAMNNGYSDDLNLRRRDPDQPWAPDNCAWIRPTQPPRLYSIEDQKAAAKWNKTVNRLRIHFGMKPFPVKEVADDGQ